MRILVIARSDCPTELEFYKIKRECLKVILSISCLFGPSFMQCHSYVRFTKQLNSLNNLCPFDRSY